MTRFQRNTREVWSPSSSVISTMWPSRLALRGLGSSAGALPVVPRWELLVQATYTLPVFGEGWTSSQRSILVAPALSAARRV